MNHTTKLCTATALALGVLPAGTLTAQESWPTEPVHVIVPYSAGGNNDRIARTLSEPMSEALGQPIVVENRAGAGGTIATGEVAKADPDGYTVVMCEIGTMGINPHVYANLTYDPLEDFEPVIQITSVPLVLGIGPSLEIETIEEFLEVARSGDRELNYASSGVGSAQHLAFEYFKQLAGIEALHIPYNGAAPARTALISGEVDAFIDGTLIPSIEDGQVTPLAVTSDSRVDALPDVPTMEESGVEGMVYTAWHGFCVPDGTDAAIVSKLNAATREAMSKPDVQERFAALNIGLVGESAEHFKSFIESESKKLSDLVEQAGAAQQKQQ
ncbi:tripartite tricarboxylate transporter substrate binding protein [Psychromarinibacter sp. C21-152]|uniref:Tripartite tricarboxylate transporter substrate binding protein n=1 Tax=Psychromarinibacter sediminicola TaxID=3033385 RepID=A0AAE3NT10_9RHOB|nr:tripartite tricarboxylate transporter substrate binding protein [Psychromarinibacter sediminicola]MDF0601109.1 tripartite tricarboxylate transporter substrate binding protein [Psychromarinibacter sediminicola]